MIEFSLTIHDGDDAHELVSILGTFWELALFSKEIRRD